MSERLSVLYATTNPGKLQEVGGFLAAHGIEVVGPQALGEEVDVPETGTTLDENAVLKAEAYSLMYPDWVVLGDDTGVEIDALNGAPGIHVRRWRNKVDRMTDEEIIAYCLEQMKEVPKGQRGAQFRTVISVKAPGQAVQLFDGILRGEIALQAIPLRMVGFPFESMFYIPEEGKMLGELHQEKAEDRGHQLTHREKAVLAALPTIKEFLR